MQDDCPICGGVGTPSGDHDFQCKDCHAKWGVVDGALKLLTGDNDE